MIKKISIITINYNNLEGLQRTVESVGKQTWRDFEYIIIDGGSTDGSAEYIALQKECFDYWISEPDKGIYNAMNKGIAKATGEYLLFLNSGDYLYSNRVLEENHSQVKDYDLIYFDLETFGEKDPQIVTYPEHIKFSYMLLGTLPHPATFIKTKIFDQIGLYDENFKIVSDWKFFMLALFKYNRTYFKVNQILSVFCIGGISSDIKNIKLHTRERNDVLNSDFKAYVAEINELNELKLLVSRLRKSRKIQLLIKLGLIHDF
jgi:glycosyltransferase involved in cell wall biosynthesis